MLQERERERELTKRVRKPRRITARQIEVDLTQTLYMVPYGGGSFLVPLIAILFCFFDVHTFQLISIILINRFLIFIPLIKQYFRYNFS